MARNQMKCPACRAGCDHALDTTSIPAHFRGDLAAKVQSETATYAPSVACTSLASASTDQPRAGT